MPSLLARTKQDASALSSSQLALPLITLTSCAVAYIGTSSQHFLLTSFLAWALLCAYTTHFKTGWRTSLEVAPGQRLAWVAGALLALVSIGEKSASNWGLWWSKGLVPCILYIFAQTELVGSDWGASLDSPLASPVKLKATPRKTGSKSALVILTASAVVAVSATLVSNAIIVQGLSNAILQALALVLVEKARSEARNGRMTGESVIYSTDGLLSQSSKPETSRSDAQSSVLRHVSFAAMIATGLATVSLERLLWRDLSNPTLLASMADHHATRHHVQDVFFGVVMVLINAVADGSLLILIQQQGALLSSFFPLSGAIVVYLSLDFSWIRLTFASLCALSSAAFLSEQDHNPLTGKVSVRSSRLLMVLAMIAFAALALYHSQQALQLTNRNRPEVGPPDYFSNAPLEPLAPLGYSDYRTHPIQRLVSDAEAAWLQKRQSQSRNLEEAVAEYRRRYGIPPPPNFDRWYEFAKRKGVQLIDEFDSIYQSLLPFWALPPAIIRARTREALGFDNMLLGLLIRDGKPALVEGGPDWQREAIVGMIANFVEFLPDMDVAFNIHDEPRVVVPHDELSRLVEVALSKNQPEAFANPSPKNAFSSQPADMKSGRRIDEVKTTRFNVFAHQPTWIPSRLSCSPGSPSRALLDTEAADNFTSYALSDMGFVYNHTAFSDVCNSPSFSRTFGFFDRPNAFNVVHDLFPIFSQSKMSSFQDILYPSPWYWFGKVKYVEEKDMEWEKKIPHLFWRGSTTGGFSRNGGWRRQHRQHIVQKLNALDQAQILTNPNRTSDSPPTPGSSIDWQPTTVSREEYKHLMDVHFSHIGQCDPGDCAAQREFFQVVAETGQQEAWKYRYLLDMDGNAFSGRFYAFLRSRSLTFKMALFREWHEEWIRPWVHFIPLSLRADEALEAVRYLSSEDEGKATAVRMAEQSSEWAQQALRNEDMEVWLFRLLLEYGRLIDDNRSKIGFAGS